MANLDLTKLVEAESNRSVATGKDITGGLFGKVTKALKLPERGLSEALGGNTQSVIDANKAMLESYTSGSNRTQTTPTKSLSEVSTDTSKTTTTDKSGSGTVATGSGGTIGKSAITGAASAYGDWISDSVLNDIIKKYSGSSMDNANEVSDALESAARKAAERDYKDVMRALGVQKQEVATLGQQQRESVEAQKKLGEQDIETNKEKDLTTIEGEKQTWQKELINTKDELGTAWRDMSMEIQRISRAGGRDSSSWAASQEGETLRDFNKSLRALSEKNVSALKSFADAVVETTQYYSEAKQKLELEAKDALNNIDSWVRTQVSKIEAQQDVALSKKLTQIEQAIAQGQQLKVQTAQQIATAELNFGLTLAQIQANYKAAVTNAASQNEADALKTIQEAGKVSEAALQIVENGMAVPVLNDDGTVSIVGKLPDGTSIDFDMTKEGFTTGILDQIAASRSKNAEGYLDQDKFAESKSSLENAWFGGGSTAEDELYNLFQQ